MNSVTTLKAATVHYVWMLLEVVFPDAPLDRTAALQDLKQRYAVRCTSISDIILHSRSDVGTHDVM
jgi:hypothetical protein